MMIYLDNAATSWPKPEIMLAEMINFNTSTGANPGRSGNTMSVEAGRVVYNAREALASFFSADDPMSIVFTSGVTHSLNIVLKGLLHPGDHVITSSMEHNSVMRPLRALEEEGVEVSVVECDEQGMMDVRMIEKSIRSNTVLIILTHASNVTGTMLPVAETGRIAKEHGILFCVDSAQTAGTVAINVKEMNIDLLCFSGHKGLLGPMGTGGLYMKKGIEKRIKPLMHGGTGSRSEFEFQPDFMPDKYESGTLNTIGIAGLAGSLEFINSAGIDVIRKKEMELSEILLKGLLEIKGIKVYGPIDPCSRVSVVSFSIEGMSPSETAMRLDEHYGILSRPGLHCAPSAHRTIATFPMGTTRFSPGYFNTHDDVGKVLEAVYNIAGEKF